MMDYGSRCPDAVPLQSVDAATVATALMSMSTRQVGCSVARTILGHRASFTRHICNRYVRQKEEEKEPSCQYPEVLALSCGCSVMTVNIPDEEDADSELITPHPDPGGTFTTNPTISTDQ